MAGFRAKDDPRNQLFKDFVDIVQRVKPKVIVFENVEGLLSYQGGTTYKEVHNLFTELGYKTEGRTLMASDYAVPQKRKRVIIICTRNDISVLPDELFPLPITPDKSQQINARETISDLETVFCNDDARYIECDESSILKFFKGKISHEEYLNQI
jgi:DNA (cytosine-5)-methyltransferase 1